MVQSMLDVRKMWEKSMGPMAGWNEAPDTGAEWPVEGGIMIIIVVKYIGKSRYLS